MEFLSEGYLRYKHSIVSYSIVDTSKLLKRSLNSPQSLRFTEAVMLLEAFGFHLSRVRGSHHIFVHPGIPELVNIQEVNGQAKAYQMRQFLKIVERYSLTMKESS